MLPATSGQRYHVALLPAVAQCPWRSTEFHMFLVALSGSAAGATRNMRADCAAWVMLHTYKSGGTTLRSLAHSWADRNFTSNYWTSSNGAFSNMHPDTTPFSVRLSKLSAPDEPATLLERTGAHLAAHPGESVRAFVEFHSAPPSHLDARLWRGSQFCTRMCRCVFQTNLRSHAAYYLSILQASGDPQAAGLLKRASEGMNAQQAAAFAASLRLPPNIYSPEARAAVNEAVWTRWREDDAARQRMVSSVTDSFVRYFASQCGPSRHCSAKTRKDCAFESAWSCLTEQNSERPDAPLVADESRLLFDVVGRTDRMLAVLRAVAALLEPRVCGRERRRNTTVAADLEFKLLSRPQGAATRAPADARIAAVEQELVGNASARAVLDPRLYGAFFPKDSTEVRTRTRASEQPPSGVHAEASQLVRCMDRRTR